MYGTKNHPLNELWRQLKYGTIKPEFFWQKLDSVGLRPCKGSWFKRHTWSLNETVLIYHGFDPSQFEGVHSEVYYDFIDTIDHNSDIQGILRTHIGKLGFWNIDSLRVSSIIELFQEKDMIIPEPMQRGLGLSLNNNETTDASNDTCISLLGKAPKRATYRKVIMGCAAELKRMTQRHNGSTESSAAELARGEDMKQLLSLLNRIGDFPDEQEVDAEWMNLIPNSRKN